MTASEYFDLQWIDNVSLDGVEWVLFSDDAGCFVARAEDFFGTVFDADRNKTNEYAAWCEAFLGDDEQRSAVIAAVALRDL